MLKIVESFLIFTAGSFLLIIFSNSLANCAQNQAPKFYPLLKSNYFFPEFNLTKPGEILLWLNATDPDDDDLRFGVEGDFYKKFLILSKHTTWTDHYIINLHLN